MSQKRIIFMGTPEISCFYLRSLHEANFNIVSVYSQPPRKRGRGMILEESPVHKFATKNNIEVATPKDLNSEETKEHIKKIKPDLIIVMGYGLKLPKFILELAIYGCFNVHVSLLPRWRGAAPIEYALMNNDKYTGITIFKLVSEMDAGPIIAKRSIPINQNINKENLIKELNIEGAKLLKVTIPNIFKDNINFEDQDLAKVTYAHKITADLRKIDFDQDVETINNQIRAFSPNPGAWFIYNNERIKIIKSKYTKGKWAYSTIINNQFHIGCKYGKICPEIIQREGKKPMSLENFLRGFDFNIGSKVNV